MKQHRFLYFVAALMLAAMACVQDLSALQVPQINGTAAKPDAAIFVATATTQANATSQFQTQVAGVVNATVSAIPTQTALSTPTPTQAIATTTSALVVESNDDPTVTDSSGWTITYFAGADLDRGDGTTFRDDTNKWTLLEIAPELWPTFPNEPNPLVPAFRVVTCADDPTKKCTPDGLEYAMDESNFCQQLAGESCRVPVAAEHYLYFTGDYDIPGIGACSEAGTGYGCMLVIVNVGRVTSDFTGVFEQGFRLHARYWNGQKLDQAMWALTSYGINTMLNLSSELNPAGIQNAGANCSVPEGCHGVHVQIVFTSGNEPMLDLTTTVTR